VKETAKRYGVAVRDVVSQPGKFVSSVVNSAVDAHEVGKRYTADRLSHPESAASMPSARELAKSSGRRLGTLGRQPRWSPQYGIGE